MRIHIWFPISLIMTTIAILGVFMFIPFVTVYAFWIIIAAYLLLVSSHRRWF